MADTRTSDERRQGYPPAESTMIRRCTVPIVGAPSRWLFDQVMAELITYLNTPGLTTDDLFATFRDSTGSFARPSLQDTGPGRWLHDFGLYDDVAAAQRLIDAAPQDWLAILRVPEIGPDTFYDMFQSMTVRWVHKFGESLGVFVWPDGHPIERLYVGIEPGPGLGALTYVRVDHGLPFEVDNGGLFAFPGLGVYTIALARPTAPVADEATHYKSGDLSTSATSRIRVNVAVAEPVTRVGVIANSLRVYHDPMITKVSIHPATDWFPAKHRTAQSGNSPLRDKNATPCGSCSKFGFIAQEDLEKPPIRTLSTDPTRGNLTIHDLPADRYTVAGYTDKGSVVTTVRDVMIDDDTTLEIGLDHTFDLTRLLEEPPERAFLQGDIIRQDQRDTNWCGPYSLAHAFSYWAPHRYNPREDNGKWAGETIRDRPETWLHTLIGVLSLGTAYFVYAMFDDPVPGTLQETMVRGCAIYGFSSQGLTAKGMTKTEGLNHLKRWIHAGVPVIVTIDEKMDQGDGHWSSEHYKTLVGYDDDATLRYRDDNGDEHTSRGALYFVNSGVMGENRGDPEVLSPERRETHSDYDTVPIGNDADSYTVFWRKWETGSIPTFSKKQWFLPVFPVNFEKVYRKRP